MKITESRIALDDADWGIRFGMLQLAQRDGFESWHSLNGKFRYNLIASTSPYEGIPSYDTENDVVATIPDPEFILREDVINCAKWVVNRVLLSDLVEFRKQVPVRIKGAGKAPAKQVGFTSYFIDEEKQTIAVLDCPDGFGGEFEKRSKPTHNDISNICYALDDLAVLLNYRIVS